MNNENEISVILNEVKPALSRAEGNLRAERGTCAPNGVDPSLRSG